MEDLIVTRVEFRFKRIGQSDKVVANCNITLNNMLKINDVRFIYNNEQKEYTIHLPTRRNIDGGYYNVVTVDYRLKDLITQAIVERYEFLKLQGLWIES